MKHTETHKSMLHLTYIFQMNERVKVWGGGASGGTFLSNNFICHSDLHDWCLHGCTPQLMMHHRMFASFMTWIKIWPTFFYGWVIKLKYCAAVPLNNNSNYYTWFTQLTHHTLSIWHMYTYFSLPTNFASPGELCCPLTSDVNTKQK